MVNCGDSLVVRSDFVFIEIEDDEIVRESGSMFCVIFDVFEL